MEIGFANLAIVAAAAFVAPLVLGLVPALRLPAVGLDGAGVTGAPLLIAIMFSATSLGVVIPVLKDSGEAATPFGQLVIAGASIADIATVVLLSLFFSGESSGVGSKLVLLAAFVVLADKFGLEAILGAFMAGAVLKLVDRDQAMTHPQFHRKLEAAGFGVFVPFFFVTSGLTFDLHALFASGSAIARVPIFLAALLAARGLPAFLYRRDIGARKSAAAGLLQATSLGFFVVAGQIGMELGLISKATGAALVAAGLLSVLLFPAVALALLGKTEEPQ